MGISIHSQCSCAKERGETLQTVQIGHFSAATLFMSVLPPMDINLPLPIAINSHSVHGLFSSS